MTMLTTMIFARDHGMKSISLFSDSQILINTIKRHQMNLEIYGVFRDIYLLSLSFKTIKFNFIPRTANVREPTLLPNRLYGLKPNFKLINEINLHKKNICQIDCLPQVIVHIYSLHQIVKWLNKLFFYLNYRVQMIFSFLKRWESNAWQLGLSFSGAKTW